LSTSDNSNDANSALLSQRAATSTLDVVTTTDAKIRVDTANNAPFTTPTSGVDVYPTHASQTGAAALESLSITQPSHSAPNYLVINDYIAPSEVLENFQEQNVRAFTRAYVSYKSRCPLPKAPWHFISARLRLLFRRFVFENKEPSQLTHEQQVEMLKSYTASIHVSFKNLLKPIPEGRYVSQAGLATFYSDILLILSENGIPMDQFEVRLHFMALWDIILSKLPPALADFLREKRNQMPNPIDKWTVADSWIIEKIQLFIEVHLAKELTMSP
jgi:hypothetical protein